MKPDYIQFSNVTKNYDDVCAVKNFNLNIKEGNIFGLLGSNGAGKTTLINILTTLLPKTSGHVIVNDLDVFINQNEVRKLLGVVFQENVIDDELSVYENLYIHSKLYDVEGNIKEKIKEMLKLVEFNKPLSSKVKSLSGGLKRRVEIARSLLHEPRILILDEPTTGLDVQTRHKIWEYISKVNKEKNVTVILTTHYLDEAHICDKVMIIDEGNIKAHGTVKDIIDQYSSIELSIKADCSSISECDQSILSNYNHEIQRDRIIFSKFDELDTLLDDLYRRTKLVISDLYIKRPTLEKAYLNCVGREIEV